jgi:hypothetical protein
VLFFLYGNTGVNLYLVPTDASGAGQAPTSLTNWPQSDIQSTSSETINGWILPNSQWVI